MSTNKKVFTLRLENEIFNKINILAKNEHRSTTNYIEYILMEHIKRTENEYGKIKILNSNDNAL